MARPATDPVPPISVKKGTVIRHPRNGPDDRVKAVAVVLHMESGVDLTYEADDYVPVLRDQPAEEEEA